MLNEIQVFPIDFEF